MIGGHTSPPKCDVRLFGRLMIFLCKLSSSANQYLRKMAIIIILLFENGSGCVFFLLLKEPRICFVCFRETKRNVEAIFFGVQPRFKWRLF